MFWDPACDPQPQHGVTTALVGNCSLSLFPVTDEQRIPIADMFAFVEDVPADALIHHVPWTWEDYAGYRDAIDVRGAGVNIAALMGHSPLRLVVMGDDAWNAPRPPTSAHAWPTSSTPRWRRARGACRRRSSTRTAPGARCRRGLADDAELETLLDVLARRGRGFVEFVPDLLSADPEIGMHRLATRCGERGIPLTWTGFTATDVNGRMDRWLDLTRDYRSRGVQLWPQLSPRTVDFRINWDSSMMFMRMAEGWHRVVQAPGADAKRALLTDPEWRDVARREWDTVDKSMFPNTRIERVRIVEVTNPDDEKWIGRSLADLVTARGGHPSDVFADFVLANDCAPGIVAVGVANDDPDQVASGLLDDGVLISSSDAGAHVQMLCASGDTTLLLTRHVRERGDLTLERAVHELTGRQAEAFGFHDRGVLVEGAAADLVVFALDELHWDDDEFVADLPDGAKRFRRPEGGYRATVVDGVAVQEHGALTGALPGRVLDVNA